MSSPVRIGALAVLAALLVGCGSSQTRPTEVGGKASESDAAKTNAQLAIRYLNQGRLELARDKIERALDQDASNPDVLTIAAVLYEQVGETDRAARYYRDAVQIDPDDGGRLNNYGVFLCKSGDVARALELLRQAAGNAFYETPHVALTNAGSCAMRIPDLESAERYYRAALQLDNAYPDALFGLSRLYYQDSDFMKARAFMQRLEASAQHSPDSLLLAYQIESALGDVQHARLYAQQLERRFPDSVQATLLEGR